MAYSTPRTWDGTETANVDTYLETTRTNNIALWDRLPKINKGFEGAIVYGDNNYKVWELEHRNRYLHYHLQTGNDNVTAAKIFVTQDLSSMGSNLVSHGGSYSNDVIMSSAGGDSGTAIDLNALTVGDRYFVVVEVEGASSRLYVLNLYESSIA